MTRVPQSTIDCSAVVAIRRGRGALAGLALVLALSACGALPEAPDVAAELPASWKEGPTGEATVSSNWIAAFGSPELTRLAALTETDNLDIVAAAERIAQAEAALTSTNAGLFPTLGTGADAGHRQTPSTLTRSGPPFSSSSSSSFSLSGNASWQLDLNGKIRAQIAAQGATVQASRFDRDAVKLSTVISLANAYLSLAAAEDQLKIARENVTIADRTLGVIRRRLEVGTATALDVAQQESVAATQRATIPDLEITRRQQRIAIAVLTGRTPEGLTVTGTGLGRLKLPKVSAGLPSRILVRRPDIAQAEATLAAQRANVAAARAAFLPDVSLTGSGGLESAFLKNLLRPEAWFSSITGSVTETIFDAGARQANLDEARARHAELAATYRKTVHSALADVENALVAIDQNRRHEQLQTAVVTAARKAQRLTEERLAEGTIDITTVLDAERTLFQAEQTLVGVRLARFQAVVSLAAAVGGGWDREAASAATTVAKAEP